MRDHTIMYISNGGECSDIKVCGFHQQHFGLINLKPTFAYLPYTKR